MRLKCDCGWEGEMWEAGVTFYEGPRVLIGCPICKRNVSAGIRTETILEYVTCDADGVSRHVDVSEEADPLDIWTKEGLASLDAALRRIRP